MRANSLKQALYYAYHGANTTIQGLVYQSDRDLIKSESLFMEIPIGDGVFEMPVFALQYFVHKLSFPIQIHTIVAELYSENRMPKYKTTERFMRDILLQNFHSHHLIKLPVKQGRDIVTYYGTHGLVLDEHFNPVLTCSWLMEKMPNLQKYKFLRPILRVHPQCVINQKDEMEKLITRKLMNLSLTNQFLIPDIYLRESSYFLGQSDVSGMSIKVEIDSSPFKMWKVTPPPFSITDKELLQVASSHLDELIQ